MLREKRKKGATLHEGAAGKGESRTRANLTSLTSPLGSLGFEKETVVPDSTHRPTANNHKSESPSTHQPINHKSTHDPLDPLL